MRSLTFLTPVVARRKWQPIKRKHHFNPASHLARFTDTGDETGKLFEHDLITNARPRTKTPRACGYITDLYQVIERGLRADEVEEWLGNERDGPGASAITEIIKNQTLPNPGSFVYRDLIRFISFSGVRSPTFKKFVSDSEITSEGKKQANTFVREMLLNANRICSQLMPRSWRLWISDGPSGEFITSDQPLGMLKISNVPHAPGEALASRDVAVFFTLSPTLAMEGRGRKGCTGTSKADPLVVAVINDSVGYDAHRNLYSRSMEFNWAKFGWKTVKGRPEFVHEWRKRKGLER